MMETAAVKTFGGAVGGFIGGLITWFFNLSPESMFAGFIGSLIGQFFRDKDTFKSTLITVSIVTIIVAFLGSIIVVHFNTYPPTAILGLLGVFVSYNREGILRKSKDIINDYKLDNSSDLDNNPHWGRGRKQKSRNKDVDNDDEENNGDH